MRIRSMISTVATSLCAALATATLVLAQTPEADAARARLQRSLETACKQYDSERQAAQLEKCNLAWFRANERDVWRLNLNPHGKPPAAPPSS